MIATNKFVYLHLHKSGGSFINACLLRFLPDARQLGYHLPRSMLPAELRGRPVLGFVRSPWSYYVSWYTFQSQRPRPNALFRCLSDNGVLDFRGTIRNMLDLGSGSERLERLIRELPPHYGGGGLNLPGFALAPIRDSGLGFYSYLYHYLYSGEGGDLVVGRTESLRTDLLAALQRFDVPIDAALHDHIRDAPALNTSRHADWRSYYDDELAAAVAARDAPIVETYGYRFDP